MSARRYTRGGTSRRTQRPRSDIARMLQDYFQPALHTTDFASLASGGDVSTVLVDNSADFSNSVLKWAKLTIRPIYDAEDMSTSGGFQHRTLAVLLHKQDQDDSTVQTVDDEETIRELRNDKKILRGPWWVSTPAYVTGGFIPPMASHMKAIVLKSFVLDREEDLRITFTNVSLAFSAVSQALDYAMKGFVRVIK